MRSDRGSASLEFIAAGVLLIVPLIYLVLVLGRVQAGTLAAEAVARQSARVFVTASTPALADARVKSAVVDGLADFNFAPAEATTTVSCTPAGANCLRPEAWVTITSAVMVTLPFVPSILGLERFGHITVTGSATEQVPLGAPRA